MYRYMKTFVGVVSGSYAGRDDGYPEQKFKVYASLADLAADPSIEDEVIYELSQPSGNILAEISEERKRQQAEKEARGRANKEAEFEKLKKELGK